MKKITTGVLILAIAIVVLIFQYINGDGPFKKSSTDVRGESYLVKRVIDGDTIIIDKDGQDERVRLIGVDHQKQLNRIRQCNHTEKLHQILQRNI